MQKMKKLTNKAGEVMGIYPESEVAGVLSHHLGEDITVADATDEEAASVKTSGSASRKSGDAG